ncbi:MAG: hypothetical protein ACRBM6_20800 [Geminicoccales bacterium]
MQKPDEPCLEVQMAFNVSGFKFLTKTLRDPALRCKNDQCRRLLGFFRLQRRMMAFQKKMHELTSLIKRKETLPTLYAT